jgi:Isoleucyl-tRNA synthetase
MVYVNAKLTRELEAEGYSREAIRRIQDMRKELDLAVDEQIIAEIQITDAHVSDLIQSMTEAIASEVRAGEIRLNPASVSGSLVKDWDIEGIQMIIGISEKKA